MLTVVRNTITQPPSLHCRIWINFVAYIESSERDIVQFSFSIFRKLPNKLLEILNLTIFIFLSVMHENKPTQCSVILNCQFMRKTSGKFTNLPCCVVRFLKLGQTNSRTIDHGELTATDWNFQDFFGPIPSLSKQTEHIHVPLHLKCIEMF